MTSSNQSMHQVAAATWRPQVMLSVVWPGRRLTCHVSGILAVDTLRRTEGTDGRWGDARRD
jgi:hypothetical protein